MLKTSYRLAPQQKELAHFHDAFNGGEKKFAIDKIGIIQFMLFKHPLYDRTFLEDVKFKYRRHDGRDFEMVYQEDRDGYDPKNEERLWELLNASLKEYTSDRSKLYGIGNSGGLDSRFIVYITAKLKANAYLYTVGNAPSDAVHIAKIVAERLGAESHHIPVEADYLKIYAEEFVETRPMYSFESSWWLSAREALPDFNLILTGFNGGCMRGCHLSPALRKIEERDELYKYIYSYPGFRTASDELLAPLLIDSSILTDSFKDFRSHVMKSKNNRPENISDEFDLLNRQFRFILQCPGFDFLNKYAWVSPYFNEEFLNFSAQLTYEERLDEALFKNTAKRYMKELIDIRFDRKPLKLTDQNGYVKKIKNRLWMLDQKYKSKVYFKGSHKGFNNRCLDQKNYQFIVDTFRAPNEIFNGLFKEDYLRDNLDVLIEKHYGLILNLLPVKIWMDKYRHHLRV